VARPLAERCAELGYGSMWSNDHPGAKGLETLAAFGAAAPGLDLGVAVIALDRTPPETIAGDIERLGLDPARLWLGVGAGFSKKPLTRMRESLLELREKLPGVRLVLAAMGPKMCALAGAEFDGVFFNWMTPEFATGARRQVEAGAQEANRETPPVFGYVRTAVGPDAAERLAKEESFYRDLHPGYRNHFDRLAEPEGTVGVAAPDANAAKKTLAAYTALDTVVVRGLASAKVDSMTSVAESAAPQ
jgi:alkanesulfonate monooxygenase SsuD/methylene tetrahydromethanopterin reductase-like flavin-dependent oxidoreductase (luciferase family)